jgi:hypothetical protein
MMIAAAGLTLLAGCDSGASVAPQPISAPPTSVSRLAGLDRVIGHDARSLVALFGTADQDMREENGRRLQFGSGTCILDAYLYPPSKGKEPLVTHVDARQPDGKDIDRNACINALTKRKEAR